MTCGGCSGAIERVLKKNIQSRQSAPLVYTHHSLRCRSPLLSLSLLTLASPANSFIVSLPNQRVLVWGPTLPPFEVITEKIAKTGKEILVKEVVEDQGKLAGLAA